MRAAVATILLVAVSANPSHTHTHKDASSLVQDKINPSLRPTSDSEFMKDDLPADERPTAKHLAFGHPYPVVQESKDYDADFVKDENDDNGEWKAQMEYDALRIKYRKEKKDVVETQKAMDKEFQELQKAKEAEQKAEDLSEEAEAATTKAKGELADADKELAAASGATAAGGDKVNKELDDLEECKKELAAAKARLQALLDKKAAADAAAGGTPAPETQPIVDAEAAQLAEETAEEKVKREKAEHEAALAKLKEEEAELATLKAKLKKAEENVRKYRRNPEYVDQDGGVYRTRKKAPVKAFAASLKATSVLAAAFAVGAATLAAGF